MSIRLLPWFEVVGGRMRLTIAGFKFPSSGGLADGSINFLRFPVNGGEYLSLSARRIALLRSVVSSWEWLVILNRRFIVVMAWLFVVAV